MDPRTCLIVGAGMSGLTAAAGLRAAGWKVTVVDKGRGVGGRMATRRIESWRFDHGAQFFTARDERFLSKVLEWQAAGVVRGWFTSDAGETHYCGADGMNAVPKHMAADLEVHTSTCIVKLEAVEGGWIAEDEKGIRFEASVLILTAPAEQSLALCEPFRLLLSRTLIQTLQGIHFDPCYALLTVIDGPSPLPPPGYEKLDHPTIMCIADNVQKGITEGLAALTVHATPRFTIQHWDTNPASITGLMLEAAGQRIAGRVLHSQVHRWRYSRSARVRESRFAASLCPSPIYFAGDSFGGPRIEGAFLSGLEAAEHILKAEREGGAGY